MSTHNIVEAWKQQLIEEGMRQGVERGIVRTHRPENPDLLEEEIVLFGPIPHGSGAPRPDGIDPPAMLSDTREKLQDLKRRFEALRGHL